MEGALFLLSGMLVAVCLLGEGSQGTPLESVPHDRVHVELELLFYMELAESCVMSRSLTFSPGEQLKGRIYCKILRPQGGIDVFRALPLAVDYCHYAAWQVM